LLNRRKLSSAAKAGLNELIKQMAFNEREERFGIEGTPAEVSMYESFIRGGGFHSQDEGWRIVPPHNPAWQPIWTAVEQFLETTHQGRKPISELHALLKAPPFGVRDGPLPLLLMTALLSKRGEIAIYRDGLYQVGLNKELLELIAHVPELFEVQEFVFDSASKKTLATIQKVITGLGVSMSQREGSPLLWVAEPLIISVSQLPDFSKKTKRLDPIEAVELRGILLKATDPHELLLVKIPSIFGLKLDDRAAEHKLAENLQECLIALYQAYPRLLDKIEGQMKATFSLVGKTTGALRSELMKRADPLDGLASDGDLSRFVNAVSQLDERDWREIVGRVVMGGKPPSVWLDNDLVDFQVRLQQLYSDFVRLEELGLEQRQTGVNQVIRVGVLQSKLKEVRESIPLSDERASEVNELANKISKSLLKFSGEDHRQVRLAALAQLFLQEMQGRES
jgi:hypothetical protein